MVECVVVGAIAAAYRAGLKPRDLARLGEPESSQGFAPTLQAAQRVLDGLG
jgi:hypothetical protein